MECNVELIIVRYKSCNGNSNLLRVVIKDVVESMALNKFTRLSGGSDYTF